MPVPAARDSKLRTLAGSAARRCGLRRPRRRHRHRLGHDRDPRRTANVEAICATPDLDAIYIGPSDLASDLGVPIATHPLPRALDDAVDHIIATAHRAGLRVGLFCTDEDMAIDMTSRGVDLVTVRNDAGLLRHATAQILQRITPPQP